MRVQSLRSCLATIAILVASTGTQVAAQAPPPVEWRVADFVATADGFTANVLFRNTQRFGASQMYGIGLIGIVTPRLIQPCLRAGLSVSCGFGQRAGGAVTVGRVQTTSMTVAGTRWAANPAYFNFESSCGSPGICGRTYPDGNIGIGLIGCSVSAAPPPVVFFAMRTCADEGFDGWVQKSMEFRGNATELGVGEFTSADLSVSLQGNFFLGPDVYTVVPEPSTWALMATGVAVLAIFTRSRRNT
jgi:hypothetical protein